MIHKAPLRPARAVHDAGLTRRRYYVSPEVKKWPDATLRYEVRRAKEGGMSEGATWCAK
jgi:hypothetical protein